MDRILPAISISADAIEAAPSEPKARRELNPAWITAVKAAQAKQATSIIGLDLRELASFTDCFLICSGSNQRQMQAISDEIELRLKKQEGERPHGIEGANGVDWILMDYGDFVVHVFSRKARDYYDLERLYRNAKRLALPPEEAAPPVQDEEDEAEVEVELEAE